MWGLAVGARVWPLVHLRCGTSRAMPNADRPGRRVSSWCLSGASPKRSFRGPGAPMGTSRFQPRPFLGSACPPSCFFGSRCREVYGTSVILMPDIAEDRATQSLKKRGSMSSLSSHEFRRKDLHGRTKDSMSTVSYMDEPSQRDDVSRLTVQMENTYQLGPTKHFPAVTVNHILKDVLTNYLQEEAYEPELCRQMTKTISEVIKARVKDFILPRYKLIVIIHIGQLSSQSIFIGSRCLWDPKNDAVSSYVFRNSSLFAVANVYAVYFE